MFRKLWIGKILYLFADNGLDMNKITLEAFINFSIA